jgi:probable rRNA maturation factor
MAAIQFFFHDVNPFLKDRRRLRGFIERIFNKEGKLLHNLSYIFCSDSYLLGINREFLKHDFYTDIITFPLGTEFGIEGEIYISYERVRENAKTEGVSFNNELHRVIFHGALHLSGFEDKSKKEKNIMRAKEDEYLALYFQR